MGNKFQGSNNMVHLLKKIFHLVRFIKRENGIIRLSRYVHFTFSRDFYKKSEQHRSGDTCQFVHVTYYAVGNVGDTVLSKCVRLTFEKFFSIKGWKIIPVHSIVTTDTVADINQYDKVIIGGGGLFLPDTNRNLISGWQWPISKDCLRSIRAPVCVFSVGYNYFRGQKPDELFIDSLCELVKKSSFFGLRNRGSVEAVRALLPQELQNKVVFQPCTTTLIRKLVELPPKKRTNCVAVNMAFDREDMRFGYKKDEIVRAVAAGVKQIEDRGYKIYYVCHTPDDDLFTPYLKAAHVKYKLIDLSFAFPTEVFEFYNKIDLVIGMRGHAQMIPFGLNCEILSLGTHDKMKWFLEDIDASDWYIDLNMETGDLSDCMIKKFVRIHESESEKTKARLIEAQNRLWKITYNHIRLIAGGGEQKTKFFILSLPQKGEKGKIYIGFCLSFKWRQERCRII